MKAKYTPGPWGSAARQGNGWDLVVFKPGTSLEICQMFHDFTNGNSVGEANAKLVSCAPEMAEMLLSIYSHVSHGGPTRAEAEALLQKAGVL